ncbi:MAG: pyrroline-5-carboxylate reductase [Verrucomicrobiales bacterium]|nr:pyrroline-5-carboxylate reductase [Verrucomicrobiales bacterium]MCP5527511.1 pyrroline-5-carboxylate reductase [Verrucomicrobiales bacterium]
MTAGMTIGFVGAGRMATALAEGLLRAGLAEKDQVLAADPVAAAREAFAQRTGARVTSDSAEVVRAAQVLVLAVKPDQIVPVLESLRGGITTDHLLISIAAGVPLRRIEGAVFDGVRVVRVMPNTPALVGTCAAAFSPGRWATREDAAFAERLLSAVGLVFEVKEALLDAVTGVSGSGPAFVYLVIEALSDGGVAAGLPRDVASRLAAQTVLGAARMVLETGQHPGVLKDMVTSPGGTTIEGLHALEKGGVRGAFMDAVRMAARKSRRLGRN